MPRKTDLNNIDLRSEEVQEILTRVPHWMIRWGSVLFLGLIIMLLFIAWFVKYPEVITAEAVITTEIPPQKVYAKVTARIDTIFVREDQMVHKEQPLAILENTANTEDVFFLKSMVDSIGLKNGVFEFPFEDVPMLFLGDIDSEYAELQNSYMQYTLNNELRPYSNQLTADEISLSELQSRLKVLVVQQELEKNGLVFRKKELKRNKLLFSKGVISAQEYENKQMDYLQAEQGFKNLNISISQTREAIAKARKTIKGTTIEETQEEMRLLKTLIQSFNKLKNSIANWERKYVLSSEIRGKVAFMTYWSENQTVKQEDLVFTIMPAEKSDYVAKLLTPAENSGKIEIGQKTNINLKNFPETEFGVLQGKIESISKLPNQDGLYLIDVSLPPKLVTTYDRELNFKQEMAGTANIITEDLRLIERFFYQLKGLFNRSE